MSLESAVQRMGELHALTQPASASSPIAQVNGGTTQNGQSFSTYLTAAQQQGAQAQSTGLPVSNAAMLPTSSPASSLPVVSAASIGAGGDTSAALSTPYSAAAGYGGTVGVGSSQYGLGTQNPYGAGSQYGVGGQYGVGTTNGLGTYPGQGNVGQRMVALAQGELGVSESSGNNDSPRIKQYRTAVPGAENTPGPWCAYFVSWLSKTSGAPIGVDGKGTGWVPNIETWGKQTQRWHTDSKQALPGDIVIFDRNGDGLSDHTGIVESVDQSGRVHTIEGNTSDRVARRDYDPSAIRGYVRPG